MLGLKPAVIPWPVANRRRSVDAMATELTEKQTRILRYIEESIKKSGFPPTIDEIRARFRFKSGNAVRNHLRALQKKGYIKRMPHTARGLILTASPQCPYCGAQWQAGAAAGARRRPS